MYLYLCNITVIIHTSKIGFGICLVWDVGMKWSKTNNSTLYICNLTLVLTVAYSRIKKKNTKKHVCGLLGNVCCFSLYFSLSVYGEYFTQKCWKTNNTKKKKNDLQTWWCVLPRMLKPRSGQIICPFTYVGASGFHEAYANFKMYSTCCRNIFLAHAYV